MFTETAKSSKRMVVVGIIFFSVCLLTSFFLAIECFRNPENDLLILCTIAVLSIGILVFFVLERMANHRVKKHFTDLHLDRRLRKQ